MRSNKLILLVSVLGAFALGSLWATYRLSERYFLAETAEQGRASLNLHADNIRGLLARYQSLPRIYAKNPHVRALLRSPDNEVLTDTVNGFLSEWNLLNGAADTYLLDRTGLAIAASNWDDTITFVGNDYSFRPYFKDAMQTRLGRFFALGTASEKRGYYFSYPVRSGPEILGVMVVKVGVDRIETELFTSPHEVFVTDDEGVILMAGLPDWRLKTLAPLDAAAKQRIRTNRQFDLDALHPVGDFGVDLVDGDGQVVTASPNRISLGPQRFLHLSMPMTIERWRLHILVNTDFARAQTITLVLLVGSLLLGIALIATVIWQRRRRLVEQLAERKRAGVLLERTVSERTADLKASNLQLEAEVKERKQAEDDLRRAQNELIQAGKLAALGQMSAALSHEFNQPLAAIRTYADNAGILLERGREADAKGNIGQIVALTERMAGLSKHLSSFARKPQESVRAISLSAALNETLELLKGRFETAGLEPEIRAPDEGVWVLGGHIRLQQVIMNLITNALDAVAQKDRPWLLVQLDLTEQAARLVVEDNGIGLPDGQEEAIFNPFFTTKDVGQGLGLGLSISFNIVKDFDGSLSAENRDEGGARFTLLLRSAKDGSAVDEGRRAAE